MNAPLMGAEPGEANHVGDTISAGGNAARGSITGRVRNAVTGQYLNNARLTIKGTNIVVFTDQSGTYRIVDVPSGSVVLQAFYTDLDLREIPLTVAPGDSIEQDIALSSSARYGDNAEVVALNPYLVSADKETDAQALAVNEQRFAPNIKNVLSSDMIGDINGSSVGDFLKFVPGVTADPQIGRIATLSIRGIGGGMTSFTANGGVPKVSPLFAGGREYHMINLSLNDISRIDITKVPTPAMAADSLAGTVDLISKSAFERSKAELRYSVNVVANSNALNFDKQPFIAGQEKNRQIHPVVDFDYTLPIGKTFGIVVTGMLSERYYPTTAVGTTYNTGGVSTGASLTNPFLQTASFNDAQAVQVRNTLSFRADWKVTKHSVLSLTNQYNYYDNIAGGLTITPTVGTVGTPTVAGGVNMSFGPTSTIGATGRGAVTMAVNESTWEGFGNTTDLGFRFDDGRWKITSSLSLSRSTVDFLPILSGNFSSLSAVLIQPVRVEFNDVGAGGPASVGVFNNAGAPVNLFDLNNYRAVTGAASRATNASSVKAAALNVGRSLDVFSFPFSVQAGGSRRVQNRDVRRENGAWTHTGPDGVATTNESLTPYLAQQYERSSVFDPIGPGALPWLSTTRAYEAWQENPALFTQTAAQRVAQERYRRTESEAIEETVDALYFQAEARLFSSRLRVLGGVRYEHTSSEGQGSLSDPDAVFVRNAAGGFALDGSGAKIRKPGSGTAGSIEELDFILRERASETSRTYDGFYPSIHFTYNITENVLLRAAYAKTYGRPSFNDIVPRTVIARTATPGLDEDDPANFRGDLTVRNPNLDPWTADNYDLSLEYYTRQGGQWSAGVFVKDLSGFYGDNVRVATAEDLAAIGFDERYVGWNIRTKFNSGSARIKGLELSMRQSLRGLGEWGQYFSVFANATKLELEGSPGASFTSFVPESANWGVSFSRNRLTLGAKWNYRGLDKKIARPAFGADGFQYNEERYSLDGNIGFRLTKRLELSASVNNALNSPYTILEYGSSTPEYAKVARSTEAGVFVTVGIKGTF